MYRVRLTNVSQREFRFSACPRYVESIDSLHTEVYVLNCRPLRMLRPHGSAVFRMVFHVPANASLGPADVDWELGPRTSRPRLASVIARIVP